MNQTGTTDVDGWVAWDTATGHSMAGTVRVDTVLDSGIYPDHGDLSAKIIARRNFIPAGTGAVEDRWGHGTRVPGILGATTNNGVGAAGGCPECVLMNGKVLDDNLNGSYSWYASGITWAADNGTVINLSVRAPRRRRPGEGRETTPGARG